MSERQRDQLGGYTFKLGDIECQTMYAVGRNLLLIRLNGKSLSEKIGEENASKHISEVRDVL